MRQWQLFIVANNIVCKGEGWGGVPPFRTNPQCSTYFDQSGSGKLANLEVHESKLIVQTFPKKGIRWELELESQIFESLFQRRPRKAP